MRIVRNMLAFGGAVVVLSMCPQVGACVLAIHGTDYINR